MEMTAKVQDKALSKRNQGAVEVPQDLPVFTPATDIYEKEDAVLVVCDVPGVDESRTDVTLEEGVLTIMAWQDLAEPESCEAIHRGYEKGMYKRSFSITADIDEEHIQASISNGVLRLTLPKSEKAKPRKITVEAGA